MSAKKKREPDDKEQSQRFVETAKQVEVDESGKTFERALDALSPHKRTKAVPKR